ncbi:hypothetical protein ABVT39_006614 [Epinephelus coioides]
MEYGGLTKLEESQKEDKTTTTVVSSAAKWDIGQETAVKGERTAESGDDTDLENQPTLQTRESTDTNTNTETHNTHIMTDVEYELVSDAILHLESKQRESEHSVAG